MSGRRGKAVSNVVAFPGKSEPAPKAISYEVLVAGLSVLPGLPRLAHKAARLAVLDPEAADVIESIIDDVLRDGWSAS